ncbi:helix-turn-helix transcriptional regulator [Adlercreutzia shanghongiae]|uniref:Helix-turn-helix transcriptional regulator n=1 Tax=Adlercreutzia shanghongiae TaxID=3111773 RepID=A0ABU6IY13_9ACTN|nr:helix-turn-helix transcriptional regulator [Adlercreutzia sp. R22]MEC4294399.1 helix-turn-helix transcriptional regulator [Adlercreutzia sp. R22]
MNLQLQRLRKLAGFKTQKEVADALGVPERRYASWEREEAMINLEQAYNCARLFGCSIDAIAGYTPPVSYADPAQEALNGYWESMNDDGRERLLGIAELAADSGKVRVQKNAGDLRVPAEVGRSA